MPTVGQAVQHTASWAETNSFYDYISSANSTIVTTIGYVNGNFYNIPLSMLIGAVLQVNPNDAGTSYGHAVVITGATGRTFSEVEICGNSPMRKAVLISDQIAIGDIDAATMRLIIPTAMKDGRDCSGGSHLFSGNHCKCSYCGYNKLTITGTMLKPIPSGSTKAITATANSNCYRIAICIKYGDTETWTEYTNTSQISKSCTFSNTGLYTITVVARDVDPADANSVTATHVFNIRVY